MSKLMEAKAPAIVRIIQNEYEHFVVYRGVVEDRVFLADPIRGNIRMSVNKFACAWLPPGKREGVLLVVAKKGVTKLPENAPLTLHYPWCRDAAPEHQAARRGLYLKSLGPVLQPVIPITR